MAGPAVLGTYRNASESLHPAHADGDFNTNSSLGIPAMVSGHPPVVDGFEEETGGWGRGSASIVRILGKSIKVELRGWLHTACG